MPERMDDELPMLSFEQSDVRVVLHSANALGIDVTPSSPILLSSKFKIFSVMLHSRASPKAVARSFSMELALLVSCLSSMHWQIVTPTVPNLFLPGPRFVNESFCIKEWPKASIPASLMPLLNNTSRVDDLQTATAPASAMAPSPPMILKSKSSTIKEVLLANSLAICFALFASRLLCHQVWRLSVRCLTTFTVMALQVGNETTARASKRDISLAYLTLV
jgi:hypothetical protein